VALTFPLAPFLSPAGGEEGGDGNLRTFPQPPHLPPTPALSPNLRTFPPAPRPLPWWERTGEDGAGEKEHWKLLNGQGHGGR
jgi:hypothetical protein